MPALQLDIEERTVRDRGQDIGQARDAEVLERPGPQLADRLGPALHACQGLVVEQHRDPVRRQPDVEFEAVARRHLERSEERREGVLRGAPPVATMGQSKHRSLPQCLPLPATGRANENVEPDPSDDSTQMRPPCCSTTCRAMARPRPVPPPASARMRARSTL